MDIKGFAVLRYLLPVIILEQHFNVLLLILEDVYASSDVNIVMMMFFELFYLFIFFYILRAVLQRSEGCGFESRLGTQKFF